jgi:hypothetical protein
VHQRNAHLARPVWPLARLLAGACIKAIYAVADLDLLRIITALDDPPRRRQRQAKILC